jgi:hypothetical protein
LEQPYDDDDDDDDDEYLSSDEPALGLQPRLAL